MKKIKILLVLFVAALGFNSCSEDPLTFTAQEPGAFSFTNSFSSEYILTPATSSNLGERFTWADADFEVPTAITYALQRSLSGDFTDASVVGSTSGNEIAITIGDLLSMAANAGLDNNPDTENPNTGQVWFRLRAYIGTGELESISVAQAMTLVLPENTDVVAICEFDELYLVGSAIPSAGWGWSSPVILPCTGTGVYSGNVGFIPDNPSTTDVEAFRFFTVNTDWGSGRNYPFYSDAGYTISDFTNAMDGDSNFQFTGTAGNYFLTVDTVNKTITVGPPQATGDCEFDQLWLVGSAIPSAGWGWSSPIQLLCTGDGIYSGSVDLIPDNPSTTDVEAFRFFTVNTDWGSGRNYPYYSDAGYTITGFVNAMDGDSNFQFTGTAGTYTLTLDTVAKTITVN